MDDMEWWIRKGSGWYEIRVTGRDEDEEFCRMRRSPSSFDAFSYRGHFKTAGEAVEAARNDIG